MKRIFCKLQQKVYGSILLLTLLLFFPMTAYPETYTLSVGESATISQTALGSGYIDNVGLGAMLDPHLGFSKNYDGSATITVKSYFDYTATVQLVFIERTQAYYSGRYHTKAETYYRTVYIKCKYVSPKPNVKPTKVYLPERVRCPLNERVYIEPIYEPNGAKGTKFNWSQSQGTAAFAYMETSDGRYRVIGISPGIGSLSVKVDNDDNLEASTIIEVVDPNYLPPDNVFILSSIEISVGGHAMLQPILVPENAATSFTWSSENSSIADVNYGKVTGKKTGTTIIKVKTDNGHQSECKVRVVENNGKDDEESDEISGKGSVDGHEYVDLGLSVKWATCNVGAIKPEDFGGYYAWGETSEKSAYNWDTYSYGTYMNEVYIGNDIKGTKYDAAQQNWGSNWRMPTQKEFSELYSKCTIKKITKNSVEGYEFTGTNGNSIFIPLAGYKGNDGLHSGFRYWSSNISSKDSGTAWYLQVSTNKYSEINYSVLTIVRMAGLPIRPVTDVTSGTPGTSESSEIQISSTNFPDANFRQYLLEQDYGHDGILTSSEISNITELHVGGKALGIKSLQGVEFFTELTLLDCSYNSIESLFLSSNRKLQTLSCEGNKLKEIDLSRNTNLTRLLIQRNDLTTLDLSNNAKIVYLEVYYNEIRGSGMDSFVNNLPYNYSGEKCWIGILNTKYQDGNICTKSQVKKIKEKGWTPYYYDGEWHEYAGSDPTGIKSFITDEDKESKAPIYDINGQQLLKFRKGINIIGGKKIVVK